MNTPKAISLAVMLGLVVVAPHAIAADAETQSESAIQRSLRLQEQIDLINAEIEALESEFGPYDRSLLESLRSLTDIMLEIEDYEQADDILERRLQLVRVTEGPQSLNQLPLMEELITNDIHRGDWESVTDRFDSLYWLKSQDPEVDPLTILQARDDVIDWQLQAVYLVEKNRRINAFRDARELIRQNTRLAEDTFAQDSLELVYWLYREAVLQSQLLSLLLAEDELGVDARDQILLVETRSAESYLREGLNLVKRIREIAAAAGDLEAEAMAMVYEADFQILLDLGTAPALYREAMDKMLEAGLSQATVDGFFQRPVVLPAPEFHASLADAIAYQDGYGYQLIPGRDGDADRVHLGTFIAWSDSLPIARRPALPEQARVLDEALQLEELEIEFTLNSRGYTRNPDILEASTEQARIRRKAREALKDVKFRPWFVDGRWQRVRDLRITYQILPD
jgi:hypothetical protein